MSRSIIKLEKYVLPEKGAIVSGPFGSNIGSRFFVDEGVPVIRGNNLTKGDRRFIDDGFVFLTEEKAAEFKNCEAITGDLVFTAAGTIGQVGVIPQNSRFERYIISNKQLRFRCDPNKANPWFLYYWFCTPEMTQYVVGQNKGSSVPLINLSVLRNLPVPDVSPAEQDKVANLVSAYDDLIENNLRRMELLEDAARHLYREWFVRLRFPGREHTRIINGVPDGWENKAISDIWEITYGKNLPTKNISQSGKFPVHGADSIIGYYNESNVDIPVCLVTCRGNGSGNIRRTYGPAFVTNNSFIFKAWETFEDMQFHFTMFCLERLSLKELRTGSAQPQLTLSGINHLRVLIPRKNLLRLFNDHSDLLFRQIDNLRTQNFALVQARDLLLPRLMSGEIAV